MRRFFLTLGGASLIATVVFAHEGVKDPDVMKRMKGMTEIGAASKVLGNMARGRVAFDPEAAQAAQASLILHASEIATVFETPASDPKSEALPAIWENFADFTSKADALTAAAEALDVTSADGIAAGIRAIGASCRSCHSVYRQ